ncbi:MAG: DUF2807 domain-containing protein [Psychroserpens sp.]|nr:DUF2807 domain-containing protein [Psychroserpens sp.]
MKQVLIIMFGLILLSCNGEDVPDCFQNAGEIIQEDIVVSDFNKIVSLPGIELIVKQDAVQKVVVETGEFLLNDIEVRVENNTLVLENNNTCNLSGDYGLTKVYVSAPNLIEIRNGSAQAVRSDGVLAYDNLRLVSEDINSSYDVNTDGVFIIQVDCNSVNCVVNNLSTIFISGQTEDLFVGYYSGDARFEGGQLVAQNVEIFQRSSNDMIINAQQSITGEIRSTGDVILVNTPPVIDVQQYYTGQLIIE